LLWVSLKRVMNFENRLYSILKKIKVTVYAHGLNQKWGGGDAFDIKWGFNGSSTGIEEKEWYRGWAAESKKGRKGMAPL